ncbi:MAG: hypothetical protein OXF32_03090 [Anaerolineaceae bacterium]|nr:hypothetical protein [Anaerolineaceae bacterium]
MAGMSPPETTILPNLVVAQRVLDKMAEAARAWQADETGEALVGLVEPGLHTNGVPGIYLLDTIAPDESALRDAHTFQQGDPHQDELLWWLQENWRARRLRGDLPPKWDVPLRYLGDWHKQPGGMTRPSIGDLRTARAWLRDADNGMDFLLAPIVTSCLPDPGPAPNRIRVDGQTRVDFWYLQRRQRDFNSIPAAVYQDGQLPRLGAGPWHLRNPQRLDHELDRLLEAGFVPSPLVFLDLLDHSQLDVCFLLGRPGAEQLFLVATPPDYPAHAAEFRTTAYMDLDDESALHDRFLQRWRDAQPLVLTSDGSQAGDRLLAGQIEELERSANLGTVPVATPPGAGPPYRSAR